MIGNIGQNHILQLRDDRVGNTTSLTQHCFQLHHVKQNADAQQASKRRMEQAVKIGLDQARVPLQQPHQQQVEARMLRPKEFAVYFDGKSMN